MAASSCAPFDGGIFGAACEATGINSLIWSVLFSAALIVVTGLVVRRQLAASDGGVIPEDGFSFRNAIEMLVDMLRGLAEEIMGEHWRSYFPLIGTIFFFVLISNLFGLIPGIDGATSNANTTWGWAVISFIAHQWVGIRHHGWGYINHFMGPSLFDMNLGGKTYHIRPLFPLYAPIELVGHVFRIVSLGIRLLAAMFADHTVVSVLLGLTGIGIPAIFMGLGVVVSFLQAYVFAMLSMIYIGLALEDDH